MRAQWNGKLRNVKVFDHALTDVSLFQIHFIKVKTELLIVKVQITLESKWTG